MARAICWRCCRSVDESCSCGAISTPVASGGAVRGAGAGLSAGPSPALGGRRRGGPAPGASAAAGALEASSAAAASAAGLSPASASGAGGAVGEPSPPCPAPALGDEGAVVAGPLPASEAGDEGAAGPEAEVAGPEDSAAELAAAGPSPGPASEGEGAAGLPAAGEGAEDEGPDGRSRGRSSLSPSGPPPLPEPAEPCEASRPPAAARRRPVPPLAGPRLSPHPAESPARPGPAAGARSTTCCRRSSACESLREWRRAFQLRAWRASCAGCLDSHTSPTPARNSPSRANCPTASTKRSTGKPAARCRQSTAISSSSGVEGSTPKALYSRSAMMRPKMPPEPCGSPALWA